MFLYSLVDCCDGYYCPEEYIFHEKEFTEEEFFDQIIDCVREVRGEPFEDIHRIRNLFRKMGEKIRPVEFDHVIRKMCDKYAYKKISEKKHSFALWQRETKIVKEVNKYHTSHYRDVEEKYLKKRFLGFVGDGGFWSRE